MSFRDLVEINRRIRESDAYKRIHKIDQLKPSLTVFTGNYFDLVKCIAACEKNPLILDIRRRQDVSDLLFELSRTLHNFAASALGLRDHTLRLIRHHIPEKGLAEAIDAERKRQFVGDPLSDFINGLRQFMLHRDIPEIVLVEGFDRESGHYQVLELRKTDLLDYEKWGAPAKLYFEQFKTAIPLSKTMEDYYGKVMGFQQWMRDQLFEQRREDFAEIEAMEEEAKPLRSELLIYDLHGIVRDSEATGTDPFDTLAGFVHPQEYQQISQEEHASLRIQLVISYFEETQKICLPDELKERLIHLGDKIAKKISSKK